MLVRRYITIVLAGLSFTILFMLSFLTAAQEATEEATTEAAAAESQGHMADMGQGFLAIRGFAEEDRVDARPGTSPADA